MTKNNNKNNNISPSPPLSLSARARKQNSKNGNIFLIRMAILGGCLGWFAQKYLKSYYFPHGLPRKQAWDDRPVCAPIDKTNEKLKLKSGKVQKIYERIENDQQERLLKGPETVFFDDNGIMYFTNDNGDLISMTDFQPANSNDNINVDNNYKNAIMTGKTTKVANLGVGRPLSGRFVGETLYVADTILGLTRIQNITDPKSKTEIVATTVTDKEDGTTSRLGFVDDVVIGPKTGMVYFTDATNIPTERDVGTLHWDIMHTSKIDSLVGPSGRLLKYDPFTDEVTILAKDIWFANGVTVDKEEEYLIFAETFRLGLIKYYLMGAKQGTTEYIMKGGPSSGYFDGVDCAFEGRTAQNSLCYAVNPSSCVPAHKLLWKLPHPIDLVFKSLLLVLPKWLTPNTNPYGGIIVVDPRTSEFVELIQDADGNDIGRLTGVTVHDNKLYLGSLHNDYIGVYDLTA